MPKALSDSLRERVSSQIQDGYRPVDIARTEGIACKTVYKIRNNLHCYGEPSIPRKYCGRRGRKFCLDQTACEAIETLMELKPVTSQSDIQQDLLDTFSIVVDQSTISRALKRIRSTSPSFRREKADHIHCEVQPQA